MPLNIGIPELENIWQAIDYEVTWLHGRWLIYRQIFGTNEQRVEILNKTAGTFAKVLQDILLDDVQMGLAKLGDPAVSYVRKQPIENLTIENFFKSISEKGIVIEELPQLLIDYKAACALARERRNKRIAHFDLKEMTLSKENIFGPSRLEIEKALECLRKIMNSISLHFNGEAKAYDLISLNSDGNSLVYMLKSGLRYRELVSSGEIPHDDLRMSKWYNA